MNQIVLGAASVAAIAMICHEANAAYCRSLGDDSQKPWADAPEWQKASMINGVEFHLANPDAGDSASHDNWLKMKAEQGWVYGEVKDEEKKTHPCIVPFDQLPPAQQFKDTLVRTIIHAAAPSFVESESSVASLASLSAGNVAAGAISEEAAAAPDADPVAVALSALKARGDEIERLAAERDTLKAAADGSANAPKASAAAAPKVRKVGVMKGEVVWPAPADLLEQIRAASTVEVAFSDGRQEIAAMPALAISGDAWKVTPAGLALTGVEVMVYGPARGQGVYSLAGYGLLLDGKQVLYRPRDPLAIAPNSQVNLSGDIVF